MSRCVSSFGVNKRNSGWFHRGEDTSEDLDEGRWGRDSLDQRRTPKGDNLDDV